eukprot:TRINITY_DN864_c0_g2_i1.p1 TRINITY_DN864_c0_g2~~TRINITY_DN864_c0_g2_i1.p1  ORF type:complete len:929 (-),score=306.49 TRINITY_DN864_c0_g2_i1:44-2830(-)
MATKATSSSGKGKEGKEPKTPKEKEHKEKEHKHKERRDKEPKSPKDKSSTTVEKKREKDPKKEDKRESTKDLKDSKAEKESKVVEKESKDLKDSKAEKEVKKEKKEKEAKKVESVIDDSEIPDEAFIDELDINFDDDLDYALLAEQTEAILLLYEARSILHKMVNYKCTTIQTQVQNKRNRPKGQFSVPDIQNILKMSPDEDDIDWISEIQELKKQLVIEIRKNHGFDREVQRLDKRIGLLIANRNNLQEVLTEKKRRKKKNPNSGPQQTFDLSKEPKKLEAYQDLFYLLQTEPKYLAKCVYLVQADDMDSFLDTTILTLYGDAFSPREEYLILQLFRLAIQNEIIKNKSLAEFLKNTTVVHKMVITYNRRKQGLEFLRKILSPVIKKVMERTDLSLEIQPKNIYLSMINEQEIKSGEKSKLERFVKEEDAMTHPEVQATMKKRLDALQEISQMFLDAVINSMNNLPYGIRWICKQIKELSQERFGDQLDHDQVLKVTGYFVYYRFVNPAIVTPDAYQVIDKELDPIVRRNLVVVGKVLQNLFNFRTFGAQEQYMTPLNPFIEKNKATVEHYFNSLVKVDDPEDHLQVTKYNELTQKTKPVILISLHEIAETHRLLLSNLDELAPNSDDDLRAILKDLPEAPPEIDEEEDREIQLTLTNRFNLKVKVEEDDEVERLYTETKELIIPVLRTIPIESSIHRLHLTDVLESGMKFAKETKNTTLYDQINKILENILRLEKEKKLTRNDKYESFLKDVAAEVTNRAAIKEQQKREIARLRTTLEELRGHQTYVKDQIEQYQAYLVIAREQHYGGIGKGKNKKDKKKKGDKEKKIVGPYKFSYKELEKKGVIKDSEVPQISRKKTQFLISSEEAGVFDVTAKIAGISVQKMKIELDDLLEKQYSGAEDLALEQVTLDVNMTIFLINKFFLGKK